MGDRVGGLRVAKKGGDKVASLASPVADLKLLLEVKWVLTFVLSNISSAISTGYQHSVLVSFIFRQFCLSSPPIYTFFCFLTCLILVLFHVKQ